MIVNNPGVLALIQDAGRLGQHRIGLTVGGPMDPFAFRWANRLCGNDDNASVIEVSIGGFVAEFTQQAHIAITGAEVDVKLNGQAVEQWQTLSVSEGDVLKLGFAHAGCRIYIAVQGGVQVPSQFGSCSTVVREKIGGVDGGSLVKGQVLSISPFEQRSKFIMPIENRPAYLSNGQPAAKSMSPLRVVQGYQSDSFSRADKALFFSGEYTVSERMDRMGYRLTGHECRSTITNMLSEGICHGAIQLPPDGQPIVLLNDRQTIGGYPKIGSVMARDTARLAQMTQGNTVFFESVTIEEAHAINLLAEYKESQIALVDLD
ncbi:biotin-dependent carboxyltransferase family protein [Marinomonas sp. C2222]|uniref:Biotin-dependent carboxyltransferase family protein n=1 Tax=Marinomonas sargassi TaxID=2984494 RepID=A0ABT2YSV7_9GAMM|nr:biotin-dependent carboxyltransferase family protein [Marinomonas sargassi]MCV2402977.1 biotin-dependent carboxyltransferase family protein [Marinomonas sargassi]